MGMLKRLDLAFSRDQEQRMYVQDLIRQMQKNWSAGFNEVPFFMYAEVLKEWLAE